MRDANISFVLLGPMLRSRQWVDFEIRISAGLRIPCIAVRDKQTDDLINFQIDCDEIVDMTPKQLIGAYQRYGMSSTR